jgi:uncharacterized protein YhdP
MTDATTIPSPVEWAENFLSAVQDRLEVGHVEYGDKSHSRPPEDLLGEINEELLDVAGWSAILHRRVARMQQRVAAFENLLRICEQLTSTYKTVDECEAGGWVSGIYNELKSAVEAARG